MESFINPKNGLNIFEDNTKSTKITKEKKLILIIIFSIISIIGIIFFIIFLFIFKSEEPPSNSKSDNTNKNKFMGGEIIVSII